MRRSISTSCLLLCLAATIGVLASVASAEARTMYEGRQFYVGFMKNGVYGRVDTITCTITVAATRPTRVSIKSPTFTGTVNWNLQENEVRTDVFLIRAEILRTNQPIDQLFEVTSDEPVVVSAMNSRLQTSDAMAVLPVSSWGREYVVTSMPCDSYYYVPHPDPDFERQLDEQFMGLQRPGEFLIMAAEDGTTVRITPSTEMRGGLPAGIEFSQILDAGECIMYQAEPGPRGSNDISGTHIVSDKKIGVISGHMRTSIPNWIDFPPSRSPGERLDNKDHLCEMLPPLETWGTNFVSVPFFPATVLGDHYRVYAAEANTTIVYDDGIRSRTVTIDDAFDFADVGGLEGFVNRPMRWTADKPVMLVQHMFTPSASVSLGASFNPLTEQFDPAMVVLAPTEQFVQSAKFQAVATSNLTKYKVMVMVDLAGLSSAKFNDKLLLESDPIIANQRIPGTDFFWCIKQITSDNLYHLETDGRLSGVIYAHGSADSYAYTIGSSLVDLEDPDRDPPLIGDQESDYKCGRLEGWILDENHDQAGIAQIIVNETTTTNFTWTIGQITDQTRTTTFTADVVDPMMAGVFEFDAFDISGNRSTYSYSYTPPQFDASGDFVFDASAFGERECQEFTLRNTGDEVLLIERIGPSGETRVSTPDLAGFPIRLQAGETLTFSVCYTPDGDDAPLSGRIFVQFECGGRYWVDVEGFVEKPVILTNGHNFGDVRVGDTVYADVQVINAGNVPLSVNGFDCFPCQGVFRFPDNPFPFRLLPGDTTLVRVCFSPPAIDFYPGDYSASNDRNLPNEFTITGSGIAPTIVIDGIDWRRRRVGTVNDSTVTISNDGNASIKLLNVQSSAPRAFVLDASRAIGLTLEPDESITLPVSFGPDQRQTYQSQVILTTDWKVLPRVTAELRGIGTLPGIVTQDIDFGEVKLGERRSLRQAVISAGGNEDLTIFGIEFEDPNQTDFIVDEARFFRAMGLTTSENYAIDAEFVPPAIASYETRVRVIHDALPAFERDTAWFRLIGKGFRRDTISANVIFNVTSTPFACLNNSMEVILRNPGNVPLVLTGAELATDLELQARWASALQFPIELEPGAERVWTIQFQPQTSGDFDVELRLDAQNGYSPVFKSRIEVKTAQLNIEFSDLTNAGHNVYPGEEVPLEFGGIIEGGQEVPLDFTMLLNYNGSSLSPTIVAGSLVVTDAANNEISLPLEIDEAWGVTRVFTSEQVTVALPARWRAEIPFLAYLDPLPNPNVSVSIEDTPCMLGTQEQIDINLNEVCANLVRFITWKPILKVTIAPNPASHDITLHYDAPEDQYVTVSLSNTLGRLLINEKKIFLKKGEHSHKLRCSDFPGGMYSVTIRSGTKVQQQSLIINR